VISEYNLQYETSIFFIFAKKLHSTVTNKIPVCVLEMYWKQYISLH